MQNIKKNDIFDESNITIKRPGNGSSHKKWDEIVGKKTNRNYNQDELINWEDLS